MKTLYATKNGAYKYPTINPCKEPPELWHSTGADNPWIMRYVGDSTTTDPLIGANPNNNGFQQDTDRYGKNKRGETVPCPNAVIGLGTDGKIMTVKTLPDDYCPWCSGSGNLLTAKANGFNMNSANFLGYYQIEVCEDKTCTGTIYGRKNPYSPKQYAELCYNEMVLFSMDHFKKYFKGDLMRVTQRTLTSHAEANKMGIASGHADPWHWLGKYGYSGDTLRADVIMQLKGAPKITKNGKAQFSGGNVYSSSTATATASIRPASFCKVTSIAEGAKHPYHLVSEDGKGVYGWVDADKVKA